MLSAAAGAAAVWRDVESAGIRLRDLDVGGGLGVPYDGGAEPDLVAYASSLSRLAESVGATLLLEPGRHLVAPAGSFVTRVLYVKDVPGRQVAVCDGGMNDLIRPSLYESYHPITILAAGERPAGPVDVVGPVCESGDFFARARELPAPRAGDLVVVGYTGAYGRVMASTYNARPLCAEVLIENGSWRLIREAGSYEDLIRGESKGGAERVARPCGLAPSARPLRGYRLASRPSRLRTRRRRSKRVAPGRAWRSAAAQE